MMARFASLVLLFGCDGGEGPVGPNDTGGPIDGESDLAQYNRVARDLAGYRTEFLDEEADELSARGNRLFWLTFPGFDPVLHSWTPGGDPVDYDFSIGSSTYNYRGGGEMIVTADFSGSDIVYGAYGVDAPEDTLGTATFEAPTDGSRWHAYAVDGSTAYIVAVSYEETALYRWIPPAAPRRMWSFDDLGYDLGEFQDFDVEGDTMIFVESGRIWRAHVTTGVGEWLQNETAIGGSVSYDDEGVVWAGDYSLYWFEYAAGVVVDLTEVINAAPYQLNETYASAHTLAGENGFWRSGNQLVYEASSGIYLYNLRTAAFTPLLLEDHEDTRLRVTWRDPVMLADGTLFVTGLESTSGSVGADGPVWQIAHPSL